MTGRYRHLTRPVPPAAGPGYADRRPIEQLSGGFANGYDGDFLAGYAQAPDLNTSAFGPIHRRTLLFILIALIVGGGLLSIVPEMSASDGAADSSEPASHPVVAPVPEAAIEGAASTVPTQALSSQPGPAPEPAVAVSPVFSPEVQYWASSIATWSALNGLDPDIVATIMQIESCGDPGATSYAGAQGLFQVMPFHFAPGEDMLDPDTNALRGLAFYNRQLEYTGQDIYLSFAGYNGGYAASGSSYPYWANETQRYYTWASGIYDEAKAGLVDSPTLRRWLESGGSGLCAQAAQRLGL